ncbi:hypothetical protein GE09DRAFT_557115 [Coniochaeta sp. 2T2.1]|nr:hypothetical protein GE09DRAFT_557115 [Coniochaeta sp. 2T2.1]
MGLTNPSNESLRSRTPCGVVSTLKVHHPRRYTARTVRSFKLQVVCIHNDPEPPEAEDLQRSRAALPSFSDDLQEALGRYFPTSALASRSPLRPHYPPKCILHVPRYLASVSHQSMDPSTQQILSVLQRRPTPSPILTTYPTFSTNKKGKNQNEDTEDQACLFRCNLLQGRHFPVIATSFVPFPTFHFPKSLRTEDITMHPSGPNAQVCGGNFHNITQSTVGDL